MDNHYQTLLNLLNSKTAYTRTDLSEVEDLEVEAQMQALGKGSFSIAKLRAFWRKISAEIPTDLRESILDSQIFIFGEEVTVDKPALLTTENSIITHHIELDAPFKDCVLISNAPFGFRALTSFEIGTELKVPLILLTETAPKEYSVHAMTEDPLNGSYLTMLTDKEGLKLTKLLIEKINSYRTETADVVYSVRTNRKNQYKKETRSVIYLSNKKCDSIKSITIGNQSCKLTCRFMVRGHWRKLAASNKLGKDRSGQYVTAGFTWVTEHERGDVNSPLKTQVRVCV